jgi:hypothetical protein
MLYKKKKRLTSIALLTNMYRNAAASAGVCYYGHLQW